MFAKRPADDIEQILIVILFKWLFARWWMGDNLPLCPALERVFNMTIKCLFVRFYYIFLSLSCGLFGPPYSRFFNLPPTPPSPPSISLFICTVQLFAQIKLRLQFSPSQSTSLCFMTHNKSVLCRYWFPVLPHPLTTLLLKPTHKTILPFAPWLRPLSCGCSKCITTPKQPIRVCVCVFVLNLVWEQYPGRLM